MITFDEIKQCLLARGWKAYKDYNHPLYQYPEYFCYKLEGAKDCCLNDKAPLYWIRLQNFRLEFAHAPNTIAGVVEITGEIPNGLWLRSSTTLDAQDFLDVYKMEEVESFLVKSWNSAWESSK